MAQHSAHKLLSKLAVAVSIVSLAAPLAASASGQLGNRSVTLGSSVGGATTSYSFSFVPGASNETIGSMLVEVCDSPLETVSCAASSTSGQSSNGADLSGVTLGSFSLGGSWSKGTTTGPGTSGTSVKLTDSVAQTLSGTPTVTFTLNSAKNPTGSNQQFYVRVTTYSDTGNVTEVDFGGMAASTATALSLTGVVPPTLQFCVGVTVDAACSTITGSTVDFGYFSPSSTKTGTSMMAASTNAQGGYNVTVNGTTLTSGSYTFPQMGTQSLNANNSVTPTVGTSEFGQSVSVSSGAGSGTAFQAYGNSGQYRFFSGDTVANATAASAGNAFTNTYAVDMSGAQAAGTYATTLTYICTGSF